jgi:hypothetical protein
MTHAQGFRFVSALCIPRYGKPGQSHTPGSSEQSVVQALPEVVSQGIHHAQSLGQQAMADLEEFSLHGLYARLGSADTLVTPIDKVCACL